MKKKVICILLSMIMMTGIVTAAETEGKPEKMEDGNYSVTVSYSAESQDKKVDLEKNIVINNNKYNLDHVDYKVVSEKNITKEIADSKELKVNKNDLDKKEYLNDYLKDGRSYSFSSKSIVEEECKEKIESYKESDYTDQQPDFPATHTITYHSDITGEDTEQTLKYEKTEISESFSWKSDFNVPITVQDYDADYYVFHNQQIQSSNEKILLTKEQRKLLVKDLGLNTDHYVITDVKWTGKPYKNNQGQICRNATATGKRYVGKYRAYYSLDNASTGKMYNVTAVYKTTVDTDKKTYNLTATGVYVPERNTFSLRKILLCAGIILALVIICIILILIFCPDKIKKEKIKSKRQIKKEMKKF